MFVVPTELRPSPIHGIGVFILVPAKKGDLIWRFDSRIDRVVSQTEMESFPLVLRNFIEVNAPWNRETGFWMLYGDNAKYCNHSDNPTLLSVNGPFSDDIAACDLGAGTELTGNYHDCYDNVELLQKMKLR
ncbi:MAG: hypothetical protein AB7H77_04780 [Bdellovibrionales bacterium]